MTKDEQQVLKKLVKEGAIDALKSSEGQGAIVNALKSDEGKDAIAKALSTEKAKDVILDVFIEAFHEVVVPVFEEQNIKIKRLEKVVGVAA